MRGNLRQTHCLRRRQEAARQNQIAKSSVFLLPLRSPFTIFREDRRRLGRVKLRKTPFFFCLCARLSLSLEKTGGGSAESNCEKLCFSFASALAFHYLSATKRRTYLKEIRCRPHPELQRPSRNYPNGSACLRPRTTPNEPCADPHRHEWSRLPSHPGTLRNGNMRPDPCASLRGSSERRRHASATRPLMASVTPPCVGTGRGDPDNMPHQPMVRDLKIRVAAGRRFPESGLAPSGTVRLIRNNKEKNTITDQR